MPQPDPREDRINSTTFPASTQDAQGTTANQPGPDGGPVPNGAALSTSEEIAQLQRERDDLRDQLLRSRAEFANYQKRAKQQADANRAYAIEGLARDLLEAIDNLERATEALRSSASAGISSGVDMVQKQLLTILAKYGVEPIPALGEPFDPNYHDALMHEPSGEHPDGTVVKELSKGYRIHERVLRPTKVAVSHKPHR
jgi:molecular chaperone GrpE